MAERKVTLRGCDMRAVACHMGTPAPGAGWKREAEEVTKYLKKELNTSDILVNIVEGIRDYEEGAEREYLFVMVFHNTDEKAVADAVDNWFFKKCGEDFLFPWQLYGAEDYHSGERLDV